MEWLITVISSSAGIIFALLMIFLLFKSFLYICNPNEILIFSGRRHRDADGNIVGYRVVFGGWAWRVPLFESVERMDMTTMPVPVEVTNAYSKGGIPLRIQAIANVKISNDREVAGNAIERFLGRDRNEIRRVARETLEGNLRGVLATLTPEQVNEDRLEFADRIAKDVTRDLHKLGLQLDTLKIQSVSDEVDYLSSIGRKQIAQIIRNAEIAESDAVREAETFEAEWRRQAEVAQTQARAAIQQRENEYRRVKAELEGKARAEEERTEARAQEARATAEQELQQARAELERLRLEADQVLPAEAARTARELAARGDAAPLAENARAAALVNDLLSKVYKQAGSDASKVFLLQQIEMVLQQVSQLPERVKLKNVRLIDNGDGRSIANLVNAYPRVVRDFLDQLNATLGIDVVGTLTSPPESDDAPRAPGALRRPRL